MIDFRYHLVSLISVFLALAVGIALGAGPLKETIGDTLTGQVDQLRTEKEQLRADLDAATADLDRTEAAMDAVAPSVLDGVLAERRIAVIELADVGPDVLEQVVARLEQSGASVTATVQVTDAWTDPDRLSFRQGLSGTLVEMLDPAPADDAGTGTELAEALVQGLTTPVPTDPDALGENAGIVLELLAGDAGLIEIEGEVTVPADAVVVLAGPTVSVEEVEAETSAQESLEPEDAAAAEDLLEAQLGAAVQIVTAAQERSEGVVVAGGELTEPSLIARLRAGEATLSRISTVEAVNTVVGQVSVPLALGARIGGTVGHYGPSPDATAVMPRRVELPPIVRTAGLALDDAATNDAATNDAATNDAATDPGTSGGGATDPADG
ncbi:copper transporter [Actinotalea subterranea]|uniref:copper transporter n=1 Tax=Actinotalea subterranea TaxID=2607497 RepID=UPI0011EFE4D9|nr:copper transporter [Actinotalea subterranea]